MSNSPSFSNDSIPRHIPRPSISFSDATATPTVPEVSLVLDKHRPESEAIVQSIAQPSFKSYSSWKKENILDSPTFTKKQVRFVPVSSPLIQQQPINHTSIPFNSTPTTCSKLNDDYNVVSTIGSQMYTTSTALNHHKVTEAIVTPTQPTRIPTNNNLNYYHNMYSQNHPQQNSNHSNPLQIDENVLQNLVTKKEFNLIYDIIQRQMDQLQLMQQQMQMLLTERQDHDLPKTNSSCQTADKGIQCGIDKEMISIGVDTNFDLETKSVRRLNESNHGEQNKINLSFYGNVVGEVHHEILDTKSPQCCKCNCSNVNKKLPAIESANHHHIVDASERNHLFQNNDRNLAMNTLALKYLPDEKLNELVVSNMQKIHPVVNNDNQPSGKGLNEISLATMRYMRKYGLISTHENNYNNGDIGNDESFRQSYIHCNDGNKRFLDASAIKRQPKLM